MTGTGTLFTVSAPSGAGKTSLVKALVERSRQRGDFDSDTAAAFTVGLKLLGEVMLKNRSHPLFEEFGPQFGQFMKRLKGNRGAPTAG